MKLIDADALNYVRVRIYHDDGTIGGYNAVVPSSEIRNAPTVYAVPVQYILTTIREWNRDGYAESAEALEILVMNWNKENTERAERKEE